MPSRRSSRGPSPPGPSSRAERRRPERTGPDPRGPLEKCRPGVSQGWSARTPGDPSPTGGPGPLSTKKVPSELPRLAARRAHQHGCVTAKNAELPGALIEMDAPLPAAHRGGDVRRRALARRRVRPAAGQERHRRRDALHAGPGPVPRARRRAPRADARRDGAEHGGADEPVLRLARVDGPGAPRGAEAPARGGAPGARAARRRAAGRRRDVRAGEERHVAPRRGLPGPARPPRRRGRAHARHARRRRRAPPELRAARRALAPERAAAVRRRDLRLRLREPRHGLAVVEGRRRPRAPVGGRRGPPVPRGLPRDPAAGLPHVGPGPRARARRRRPPRLRARALPRPGRGGKRARRAQRLLSRPRSARLFLDERSSLGAVSTRGCVFWNARARETHVEAIARRSWPSATRPRATRTTSTASRSTPAATSTRATSRPRPSSACGA